MKILHTSDWHLGKYLNNYSRHKEQIDVLNEIAAIADREHVDAVLIAGDLFDTFNPPIESTELFYKAIKKLALNGKRAVIAIAGNHDSPDRIEAPDPLARECGIIFAGYPNSIVPLFCLESGLTVEHSEAGFISVNLPGTDYPLRVLFTPYANEYRLKTYLGQEDQEEELRDLLKKKWHEIADRYCDNLGVNILMAHLLFMKRGGPLPEEPEDEKPILHIGGAQAIYTDDIPSQIQYTALGHLHRRQFVVGNGSPVIYSGSPLAYSFSEANQTKYVQLIDVEPGKPAVVSSVALEAGKKLLRKRAESIDEAVAWLKENESALVELTMVTDTFLTADDRRSLSSAHNGIVSIIPELKSGTSLSQKNQRVIDLTKDMEGLFADYFYHAKGQKPNEGMLKLFREVLSEDENN
jgi:exonuclease SbcD